MLHNRATHNNTAAAHAPPIHGTRSFTQAVMFHNRSQANVQMKNTEELQAQEL